MVIETLIRIILAFLLVVAALGIGKAIGRTFLGGQVEMEFFKKLITTLEGMPQGTAAFDIRLEQGSSIIGISSGAASFKCHNCLDQFRQVPNAPAGSKAAVMFGKTVWLDFEFKRPETECSLDKSCLCLCRGTQYQEISSGDDIHGEINCKQKFCQSINVDFWQELSLKKAQQGTAITDNGKWENGFFYTRLKKAITSNTDNIPTNGILPYHYELKTEVSLEKLDTTIGAKAMVCPYRGCLRGTGTTTTPTAAASQGGNTAASSTGQTQNQNSALANNAAAKSNAQVTQIQATVDATPDDKPQVTIAWPLPQISDYGSTEVSRKEVSQENAASGTAITGSAIAEGVGFSQENSNRKLLGPVTSKKEDRGKLIATITDKYQTRYFDTDVEIGKTYVYTIITVDKNGVEREEQSVEITIKLGGGGGGGGIATKFQEEEICNLATGDEAETLNVPSLFFASTDKYILYEQTGDDYCERKDCFVEGCKKVPIKSKLKILEQKMVDVASKFTDEQLKEYKLQNDVDEHLLAKVEIIDSDDTNCIGKKGWVKESTGHCVCFVLPLNKPRMPYINNWTLTPNLAVIMDDERDIIFTDEQTMAVEMEACRVDHQNLQFSIDTDISQKYDFVNHHDYLYEKGCNKYPTSILDKNKHTLVWVPQQGTSGDYNVKITATDDKESAALDLKVKVIENTPPEISLDVPDSMKDSDVIKTMLTISDKDRDEISKSVQVGRERSIYGYLGFVPQYDTSWGSFGLENMDFFINGILDDDPFGEGCVRILPSESWVTRLEDNTLAGRDKGWLNELRFAPLKGTEDNYLIYTYAYDLIGKHNTESLHYYTIPKSEVLSGEAFVVEVANNPKNSNQEPQLMVFGDIVPERYGGDYHAPYLYLPNLYFVLNDKSSQIVNFEVRLNSVVIPDRSRFTLDYGSPHSSYSPCSDNGWVRVGRNIIHMGLGTWPKFGENILEVAAIDGGGKTYSKTLKFNVLKGDSPRGAEVRFERSALPDDEFGEYQISKREKTPEEIARDAANPPPNKPRSTICD